MKAILAALLSLSLIPVPVRADPTKEFIMACTYGVLAGTLVGAATLAFTSKPGDNLNNIARGASLGLYAGMGLGAYVGWVVPNQGSGGESEDPNAEPIPGAPGEGESDGYDEEVYRRPLIIPVVGKQGGLDGVMVSLNLLRF